MDDELYAEQILEYYRNPLNKGSLKHANIKAHDSNPTCGDEIQIELKINSKKQVEEIAFNGRGCAISQASASMLTELSKGKTLKEISSFSKNDVLKLLGVPISPTRLKCALLSLKVLKMAAYIGLGLDAKKIGWET